VIPDVTHLRARFPIPQEINIKATCSMIRVVVELIELNVLSLIFPQIHSISA